MDAVAASGSISPVSTLRMIRKYRYHIRIRRNIKRVQSSVASEHAEVTGRSLIERRALVRANGGWSSLPATLPLRRSWVPGPLLLAPCSELAAFIADGPQSIQIAISMHMKRG